jgi:hypothetical protein
MWKRNEIFWTVTAIFKFSTGSVRSIRANESCTHWKSVRILLMSVITVTEPNHLNRRLRPSRFWCQEFDVKNWFGRCAARCIPLQRSCWWYSFTKLHDLTFRTLIFLIQIAVTCSNLTLKSELGPRSRPIIFSALLFSLVNPVTFS